MLILVDKPKGITSHDVVDRLRRITGEKKIGHAGTLDPNATGLLIVGITRQSTKLLGDLTINTKKVYEAEVFLGETRDTDDVEGKVVEKKDSLKEIEKDKIIKALMSFEGEQIQTPPIFSAIKKKGKKAYDLARKGKEVKLDPRNITIYSIKFLEYDFPLISFKVKVSSGTYIRAIARDLGEKLGVGAFLKNLRRTEIGDYSVKNATKLDKITEGNWKDLGIK